MARCPKTGIKVLQLAAVDVTIRFLFLPLIDLLRDEGYEVHIACSYGRHLEYLHSKGHTVHAIPIARRVAPFSNLKSLFRLFRLMRKERFDTVHVHTPVAAALGRIAAKLAQVPIIIYTAHGFYFHDLMPRWKRRAIIWIERWLGRCCTDILFSQSAEDAKIAVQERIMPEDRVVYIGNGVPLEAFGLPPNPSLWAELGLGKKDKVVGFIKSLRFVPLSELKVRKAEIRRRRTWLLFVRAT